MKYRPIAVGLMWDYLYARRMLNVFNQPLDMINSPFAFPRLPSRANQPLGISNAGRIKDSVVNDKNAMMGRLFDYHEMFQRHASGLFNLSPSRFVPGHPMNMKVQAVDMLQEENDRLRKENSTFKTAHTKEKKK
ncbi:MAG: hypothetical protein ACREA3_01700 [Nitrosotalea sp.]